MADNYLNAENDDTYAAMLSFYEREIKPRELELKPS